jgi:hypothetical protein
MPKSPHLENRAKPDASCKILRARRIAEFFSLYLSTVFKAASHAECRRLPFSTDQSFKHEREKPSF